MFLLNLFLLRLWLGSRLGRGSATASSSMEPHFPSVHSFHAVIKYSHRHWFIFFQREKKKRLGSLCFPPTPTDFSLSPCSSYEAKKVLVCLFFVKTLIFVSGHWGKTENNCRVKLNFFFLFFPFLIAHPKQAQSQFLALNIHFQTSNKVRFQIKGGNLKGIKCPILHRFQLCFKAASGIQLPTPTPRLHPSKKKPLDHQRAACSALCLLPPAGNGCFVVFLHEIFCKVEQAEDAKGRTVPRLWWVHRLHYCQKILVEICIIWNF